MRPARDEEHLMSKPQSTKIDRFSELANIGAGHAAGAFAQMTGHSIQMDLPRIWLSGVRVDGGKETVTQEDPRDWASGVIFEFDGCLDAVMAVLFRREMCDAVVRQLVGQEEGELPPQTVESALMEVGNVLASHVASAIANTLGARLLPSIPMLSLDAAFDQLEVLAATRPGAGELWIECELIDPDGQLGGLVVLIPDREPGASAPEPTEV